MCEVHITHSISNVTYQKETDKRGRLDRGEEVYTSVTRRNNMEESKESANDEEEQPNHSSSLDLFELIIPHLIHCPVSSWTEEMFFRGELFTCYTLSSCQTLYLHSYLSKEVQSVLVPLLLPPLTVHTLWFTFLQQQNQQTWHS